jgi:hypothetical protein
MIDIGVTNAKTTRIRVKNKQKLSTKYLAFLFASALAKITVALGWQAFFPVG